MIYFFDNELNVVKVTASKNVISAVHEHELNGLILGTVETDLSYTEAFIDDVDYFGYYYKDNYYLHKIKRVEHEHENELVRITGRHIFFEDMIYGDYIRDVRPENRDALYILNQTISANTRWQTVMTDTSKLHSETYYWVPPMEVLNDLTENVGIEYEPKILFDGQNINGFQLHVANRIGEDKPIRVPFGSRVLNLKYEVDYSEIVTALYGHGKGEEVGDGYGRRINFRDIVFRRNGVVSPVGQLYMENPNVTAQYGKDDGSPKFGRVIFEDIESTSQLAIATYEAYMEQSRPKMLFEASVVDLGDVGMGDGVLIIRREYDVYFNARIHKLTVDLLDAENANVELGDYAHFKESKVQRKTRENNNQYRRETSSRIQQLKEQFNDRFDGEVNQMREDFEQALIDAHAEIQAAEERMETLISTTRNDWTDTFEAEVAEIYQTAQEEYDLINQRIIDEIDTNRTEIEENFDAEVAEAYRIAQENYDAINQRITGEIDTTRTDMQEEFDSKVSDAREYADIQIADKEAQYEADWNQRDADIQQTIETVVGGSIESLDTNLLDVNSRLFQTRNDLIERINNIDTQSFNLIRGSRFDEVERYTTSGGTVHDDEDMPYFRYGLSSGNIQYISTEDDIQFEAGKTYTLSLDYRTSSDVSIDYLRIIPTDGSAEINIRNHIAESDMAGIIPDDEWHRTFMTFTVPRNLTGNLRIGSDFTSGTKAQIDIRLPYLTTSSNTQWVFHPSDSYESIMSIMTRLDEFESRVVDDLAGVSGELSSAREALQAQLDEARAELERLEVGGRNLILDSITPTTSGTRGRILDKDVDTPFGIHDIYCWTERVALLRYEVSPVPVNISEKYVFSFYAKTKNPGQEMNVMIDISDEVYSTKDTVITDEWQRFYTKAHKLDKGRLHVDISLQSDDVPVYIAFWQLESGDKLTPWTPALEDTEEKITSISESIEYIDGQLEAKLNRTEIEPIQNKITEYGTTLDANAESIGLLQEKTQLHDDDIEQWSNQATTTAEEVSRILTHNSEQDGLITSVTNESRETAEGLERAISRVSETESGLESAQLDIDMNADKLSLTMTRDEFEGATVGMSGRNLLLNTPTEETEFIFSGWNGNTWRITDHLKDEMVAGGDFTASIDFKDVQTIHGVGLVISFRNISGGTVRQLMNVDEFYQTGDEGRYIYSLNIPPITGDVAYVEVSLRNGVSGEVSSGIMSRPMLNKGTKALPYSPAPEDIQADISQLNTDINIEAGRINALLTRTSSAEQSIADINLGVDGITADFASYKKDIDSDVGALSTQVASYEASVDGFRAEVGTLQGDIDGVDSWIEDKGSIIDGNADAISARVWNKDIDDLKIGNDNILKYTEFTEHNLSKLSFWNWVDRETFSISRRSGKNYVLVISYTDAGNFAIRINSNDEDRFTLVPNQEYILAVEGYFSAHARTGFTYSFILRPDGTGQRLPEAYKVEDRPLEDAPNNKRYYFKFTSALQSDYEDLQLLLGTYNDDHVDGRQKWFRFTDVMLSKGNKEVEYRPSSKDSIKHTDFILQSDGFFLGGNYVGGDHYSTAIVGSKDGIDILAERMRVTGDLIVKGDVEAWSMAAVKAEFGSLWADEFSAITIDVDDIQGVTAEFERMYTLNANIEKLVAQHVFSDGVSAIVGDFVEVNAGSIVTSGLSANVITADHIDTSTLNFSMISGTDALIERLVARSAFVDAIQGRELTFSDGTIGRLESSIIRANVIKTSHLDVDTTMVRKFFATTARIDQLITRNHFVDNVKTLSIDAVYADLRRVDSEIMTSNIIKSDWLKVDTALFERFTSSEAFIERLEVKAANIRDLTGIHIRGGMLESLNGRTRFNLDTGLLQMDNTDFRLGGNAHIRFTNRNNRLIYSNVGISAGLQFDHTIGTNNPMVGIGVSDGGFSMNDSTFRGIRIHSLGSEGSNADGTNIISQEFGVYSVADASGSGYKFKLHAFDGVRGIHPISTGRFNYDLGQSSNRWRRVYLDDLFTGGDGRISIQDTGGDGGYFFDTRLRNDGFNITFRGINTSSNSYNIGNSNYRFSYIYLRYNPNVNSDARLKEDIRHNDLGLNFIRDLETKTFKLKPEGSEIESGPTQYGIIAQQMERALIKHNVDVNDINMLSKSPNGYYGAQYEQLIIPTIKAVQEIDFKVESNTEKIARLEKEIEQLKGA